MNPAANPEPSRDVLVAIPGRRLGDEPGFVTVTPDGVQLRDRAWVGKHYAPSPSGRYTVMPDEPPGLVQTLLIRALANGSTTRSTGRPLSPVQQSVAVDHVAAKVLVLRRSERWREALSTALVGPWCDPLWQTGHLTATALGALKAEARAVHRQLVPVWRHGTRAGRVLSLDADLGGLSLYDLVAPDVDLLARATGGVFVDGRLNAVLRGLAPAERAVVLAYAEGEGTTWTEAAAHTGAAGPEAFGERVRRKAKRLADEQRRRAAQRLPAPPTA
ncbi:hypothetical protein [Streptomyces griseoruber]|uniref:hypothetical protein n=1 Tax=Streptomyces griseoruber TaxID=1943 RepID=UPI0006E1C38A|nr:hypothetical protein [Streptomyces griseoruber]